jgi:hypothetical protein
MLWSLVCLVYWVVRVSLLPAAAFYVLIWKTGLVEFCLKQGLLGFFRWKFRLPVTIESVRLALDTRTGLAYISLQRVHMYNPPAYICEGYQWEHKEGE